MKSTIVAAFLLSFAAALAAAKSAETAGNLVQTVTSGANQTELDLYQVIDNYFITK